jgi:ABC-type dipeptide/oligopeptide/nickel transport system ATPase component
MYLDHFVEMGLRSKVFNQQHHQYIPVLLSATPAAEPHSISGKELFCLENDLPRLNHLTRRLHLSSALSVNNQGMPGDFDLQQQSCPLLSTCLLMWESEPCVLHRSF